MTASRLGTRIARYEILAELGRGGMSIVYRARDTHLQRVVALKLLHAHLAELPEARERFRREAVAVARLHHPHIVQIHDFSDSLNAETYLVMACVDGVPLAQVLDDLAADGGMLPEAAMVLARAVVDALVAAHAADIVHRDLKPENILVARDGTLKLTDFGIARILDNQTMTMTGALLGSPAYMAPEYIEGRPSDARADFFSLGVMLYQMCTGRLPFEGTAPHAVLKKIASGVCTPAEQVNPGIHAEIGRLIRRCMATRAEDRHLNAVALRDDIDAFLGRLALDADTARAAILADPRGYAAASRESLATQYKALGYAALRDGKRNAAFAHFDRVLSVNGDDREVRKSLRRLARRGRVRRVLLGGATALATAGLVLLVNATSADNASVSHQDSREPSSIAEVTSDAGTKQVQEEQPHSRDSPSVKDQATTLRDAATQTQPSASGTARGRQHRGPATAIIKRAKTHGDAAAERGSLPGDRVRNVQFKPAGSWVTLTIDNATKPVVENAMRSFFVPLTHGQHTLRFTNPMAHPYETTITVDDRDTRPMVVRLQPLDAHLLIEGAPAGSRVHVGEHTFVLDKGSPRETVAVPLDDGHGAQTREVIVYGPDGEKELHRGLLRFRPGETRALALASGED